MNDRYHIEPYYKGLNDPARDPHTVVDRTEDRGVFSGPRAACERWLSAPAQIVDFRPPKVESGSRAIDARTAIMLFIYGGCYGLINREWLTEKDPVALETVLEKGSGRVRLDGSPEIMRFSGLYYEDEAVFDFLVLLPRVEHCVARFTVGMGPLRNGSVFAFDGMHETPGPWCHLNHVDCRWMQPLVRAIISLAANLCEAHGSGLPRWDLRMVGKPRLEAGAVEALRQSGWLDAVAERLPVAEGSEPVLEDFFVWLESDALMKTVVAGRQVCFVGSYEACCRWAAARGWDDVDAYGCLPDECLDHSIGNPCLLSVGEVPVLRFGVNFPRANHHRAWSLRKNGFGRVELPCGLRMDVRGIDWKRGVGGELELAVYGDNQKEGDVTGTLGIRCLEGEFLARLDSASLNVEERIALMRVAPWLVCATVGGPIGYSVSDRSKATDRIGSPGGVDNE